MNRFKKVKEFPGMLFKLFIKYVILYIEVRKGRYKNMNIKDILNSYNEFTTNYYMNNQDLIDNDYDRKIAEEIANEEYKEMEEKKYE